MAWPLFLSSALLIASYDCASISESVIADGMRLFMNQERRDSQLGNDLRDVFKIVSPNVITNTLFDRDVKHIDGSPGPLDLHSEYTLRLHNFDNTLKDLVILPRNFLLDSSNFQFNPNRDWGFHLGNWYVIRKLGNDGKSLHSRFTSSDNRKDSWADSQFGEFNDEADDWFAQQGVPVTSKSEKATAEDDDTNASLSNIM